MTTHDLKVQQPYYDAIEDGTKTFEVRRNDRAYQAGDVLILREWHPYVGESKCRCGEWTSHTNGGHATDRAVTLRVTFVYSGDPRFGGIEPGSLSSDSAARRDHPPGPRGGRRDRSLRRGCAGGGVGGGRAGAAVPVRRGKDRRMSGRHARPIPCDDHRPVQHRDGKPPWCRRCGLTADGTEPVSRIPREQP